MKKVIVFGAAGVGVSVASILALDPKAEMVGYLNDKLHKGEMIGKYTPFPVLGNSDDYINYLDDDDIYFSYAFGSMKTGEYALNKINSLNIPDEKWYSAIHPTAVVPEGFCKLGRGVIINALSQVGVDVEMGDHSMLFANSYVGHDTFMDTLAHCATNAVIGSYCHIGKAVHVGMNAVVKEKVTIGDFSVVGAGAVVLHDVPPYAIVAGVPAKIIKYRFDEKFIEELLKIKWWDWPREVIVKNMDWMLASDINEETVEKMKEIAAEIKSS